MAKSAVFIDRDGVLNIEAGYIHKIIEPQLTRWSTWRKPNTGMLVAAAWEHDLDLRTSFVIGDEATDIDMAHNAGAKGILVQTGYGKKVLNNQHQHPVRPDFIAPDFANAVQWIGKKIAA